MKLVVHLLLVVSFAPISNEQCTLSNWGNLWETKVNGPNKEDSCTKIMGQWDASKEDTCACYLNFDEKQIKEFDCELNYEGSKWNPFELYALCESTQTSCSLENWGPIWTKALEKNEKCKAVDGKWDSSKEDVCACFSQFDSTELEIFDCPMEYRGHDLNPFQVYQWCTVPPDRCTLENFKGMWAKYVTKFGACDALTKNPKATPEETCACYTNFQENDILNFDCELFREGDIWNPFHIYQFCEKKVPDTCNLKNFGSYWDTLKDTPECSKVEGEWKTSREDTCSCYELMDSEKLKQFDCELTMGPLKWNPLDVYEWCLAPACNECATEFQTKGGCIFYSSNPPQNVGYNDFLGSKCENRGDCIGEIETICRSDKCETLEAQFPNYGEGSMDEDKSFYVENCIFGSKCDFLDNAYPTIPRAYQLYYAGNCVGEEFVLSKYAARSNIINSIQNFQNNNTDKEDQKFYNNFWFWGFIMNSSLIFGGLLLYFWRTKYKHVYTKNHLGQRHETLIVTTNDENIPRTI